MFFRGEFFFLSNFFPVSMKWMGIEFPSAEHVYQAHKFKTREHWEGISRLSAGKAKRYARGFEVDPSWEQAKVLVMKSIVERKFKENPKLAQMLIETKRKPLIEDNYWHDLFWGRCLCDKCREKPFRNELGKILMEVRDCLTKR